MLSQLSHPPITKIILFDQSLYKQLLDFVKYFFCAAANCFTLFLPFGSLPARKSIRASDDVVNIVISRRNGMVLR